MPDPSRASRPPHGARSAKPTARPAPSTDVTFELRRGEVHALLGENGAGKSTMMKILSGAVAPDSGRMFIEGRPYAPAGPLDGLRSGISMIYQELNLAPHLTVEENIMLGREAHAAGLARPPGG